MCNESYPSRLEPQGFGVEASAGLVVLGPRLGLIVEIDKSTRQVVIYAVTK